MSDLRFISLVVAVTIVIVVLSVVLCGVNVFLTRFLRDCYFTYLERKHLRLINFEDSVDCIEEQKNNEIIK